MSNLLEQAIIDATALREVAMKSAEASLLEKYSKEFKESVEKLLEQEGVAPTPEDAAAQMPPELGAEPALPEDPMAAAGQPPEEQEDDTFKNVGSSFLDDDEVVTIDFNFDKLKKQVKDTMSAAPVLATPEQAPPPESSAAPMMEEQELEEEYESGNRDVMVSDATNVVSEEDELEEDLYFDEMLISPKKAAEKAKERGVESKREEEGDDSIRVSMASEEEELEEEFDLQEADLAALAAKAGEEKKQAGAAEAAYTVAQGKEAEEAAKKRKEQEEAESGASGIQGSLEENIEISQEELDELMEELKVDISVENLSDGHMGTTVTQKREQRNLEMAAARDSKAKEKREEEEKEVSDLKEKLKEAVEAAEAFAEENQNLEEKLLEMEQHLLSLKENVEKLSISNAKLLYTNKVLGNVSLNERQKEQIVENISKSSSVLEAKTIYNTLQGAVSGVGSTSKPKESLSEALIRGSSPFLNRKQQTVELSFSDRMKKLAGITKES